MSTKKIIVPEGMEKSAVTAVCFNRWQSADGCVWISPEFCVKIALETALQWLSENPIIPTENDIASIARDVGSSESIKIMVEWQRRMFLAPEPEVPEAIKDLMCDRSGQAQAIGSAEEDYNAVDRRIMEAYRRGTEEVFHMQKGLGVKK